MKSSIRLLIVIILCAIMISCRKSFLDVPQQSIPLRQTYVIDLKTTEDYLKGIYIPLSLNFYRGYYIIYPELVADNVKPVTIASSTMSAHYNWTQTANESSGFGSNVNDLWMYGYQIAHACSFVLEKAEQYRAADPIKADNIKAQAYALRALVHFVLANTFSQSYSYSADGSHLSVPYIQSSDWTLPIVRLTSAEVYKNMIQDLSLSISLFHSDPTTKADLLYMNKIAAKAVLARVYMFKGDFAKAKNLASEIAIKVPLLTTQNGYPLNVYKSFIPSQTEVLFQLSPSQGGIQLPDPNISSITFTGTYTTLYQGRLFVSPKTFVATNDIALLLNQNSLDPRKTWVAASGGVWNVSKFPQSVVGGITASASYYECILRSSEMFLTAAESYARVNMADSARFFLNAIRTRSKLTPVASSISGTNLMDSIYKERRRELCFEGLRMFDLLRWKQGVSRVDAWSPKVQILLYPDDKAVAPIPAADVNIAGLNQNAGY